MTNEERTPPVPSAPVPGGETTLGSGEGADTALEALIRKRKLAESPDPADGTPPQPPSFAAVPRR